MLGEEGSCEEKVEGCFLGCGSVQGLAEHQLLENTASVSLWKKPEDG